jgi:aconitate hydratase
MGSSKAFCGRMQEEPDRTGGQHTMTANSFGSRATLQVGGAAYEIHRLDAVPGSASLPFSLKVLLENLLRTEDGHNVTPEHISTLTEWDPAAQPGTEIQFTPARVILQDLTGVPAVVDLATMREAMRDLGGDPGKINPLVPAELVIDHSVVADVFGRTDAFQRNVDLEFGRNQERFQFLRWGQESGGPAGHRHRAPGQHRAPGPGDHDTGR